MKLTKRKGFNFFRSYFDVYNELDNDADKVAFMGALLDRQFLGIKPIGLSKMSNFAYISQTNSIDSQVRGYEDKTRTKLNPLEDNNYPPLVGGSVGGSVGGVNTPCLQVQVKEKEKEKVNNNKGKVVDDIFNSYKLKYKIYTKELCQDRANLENISRMHKISSNETVFIPTIKTYYIKFLDQLDISQEKHESKSKFNSHFSNWLRKKSIKNVMPIQKLKRYV